MSEAINAEAFIRNMLNRGWEWSENEPGLLVHPDDHEMCVRHDRRTDTLSVSPKLSKHLELVILTPSSKGRFWR